MCSMLYIKSTLGRSRPEAQHWVSWLFFDFLLSELKRRDVYQRPVQSEIVILPAPDVAVVNH